MSNRARRPHRRKNGDVAMFPETTPMSIYEQLEAAMMAWKHEIHFEELGAGVYAVVCTCPFEAPAPYGLEQAEKIKEQHYARWHVIPDPMGAKYRV